MSENTDKLNHGSDYANPARLERGVRAASKEVAKLNAQLAELAVRVVTAEAALAEARRDLNCHRSALAASQSREAALRTEVQFGIKILKDIRDQLDSHLVT